MLDDHYIRFRFSSVLNRGKDKPYEVFANTMDEMKMFLTQHCFKDVDNAAFEFIPKNLCKHNDMILELYSFKSNHSNDVYHVMTTKFFVERALEDTAADINYTLLFGEAILRHDIEIFKHICDLLWNLPCVHVKDVLIADDESINKKQYFGNSVDLVTQYYESFGKPWEDCDSQLVIQSLYDSLSNEPGEIYPITIEAYVSSFTTLLTDICNT